MTAAAAAGIGSVLLFFALLLCIIVFVLILGVCLARIMINRTSPITKAKHKT